MLKNISRDLNDFLLPKDIKCDSEYEKDLKLYLEKYFCKVEWILSDYIAYSKCRSACSKCLSNIKKNIDLINKCIQCYYNGQIREAYNCIKDVVEAYLHSPFIVASIDENYAFRGAAPKNLRSSTYSGERYESMYENMQAHKLSFFKARVRSENIMTKDMLHIPFDKRGLVATQRFSIAGLPCIYLSTTSYGTWLELDSPKANEFQVSSYKIPNNLKILNLCIWQDLINGKSSIIESEKEWYECLSCFEIFPLVIATSYHVNEKDRKFKSEYIVSQLVMQVCNELEIDGVAYLSKRIGDSEAYPQAVNLAIAIPYNEGTLYWNRSDEVLLTKPVKFSDYCEKKIFKNKEHYLSYVNEIYKDTVWNDVTLDDKKIPYTDTKFSEFDEYLLGQQFFRYTEICNK